MSIDLSRPTSSCAGEDFDSLLEENSDSGPDRGDGMSRSIRPQRSDILLGDETDDADDLVLNTNFDLGLFDYNWSDDTTTNNNNNNSTGPAITTLNEATDACDSAEPTESELGVPTTCDYELSSSTSKPSAEIANSRNSLHPQAIPSSANCPPIEHSSANRDIEIPSTNQHSSTLENSNNNIPTVDWRNEISSSFLCNAVPTQTATNGVTGGSFFVPTQPASSVPQPPFLLFDAPIELRANFIASQRAHGFPILDDNNSFHYGQTTQLLQQQQQRMMVPGGVNLVDGRHGGLRNKRVKNEREQKRTQKITDLIEQLREKMEEGGWKVGGAKSKYATLSTCAEYVKHLVKATKEQELALEKTRQDLEAKRRKIEDDSENQQDPSDPESTISSLTVSSTSTSFLQAGTSSTESSNKKRGLVPKNSTQHDSKKQRKQPEKVNTEANESSSTSSTSNMDSSSQGPIHNSDALQYDANTADEASNSSKSETLHGVSSVGAVARGFQSRSPHVSLHDSIGLKKPSVVVETTSMDSSFKLDYEEVFVKSSVPQLLATTAGKIVAWNDIFLKASGLLASDIDSLTIFSLVRQTELIKLFEIVAAALRSGSMTTDGTENNTDETPPLANEGRSKVTNYTAITLPCTSFRARYVTNKLGELEVLDELLYMTVTLMTDNDPKKRCFHCVFTNSPGTNGALGSVTPQLLSVLFTNQSKQLAADNK